MYSDNYHTVSYGQEEHSYRPRESPRRVAEMENAVDEVRAMISQEQKTYGPVSDYLSAHSNIYSNFSRTDRVSEEWRRMICEWSYEVVDFFEFDREVVAFALSYLDRAVAAKVQKEPNTPIVRRSFQLIASTSLYMALKLHGINDAQEGPRRKMKLAAFVELSRGLLTQESMEQQERQLLDDLEWKVNPPTTVRFLTSLLNLLPGWDRNYKKNVKCIFERARYLTELSVIVSNFSFEFTSSQIALAAILAALEAAPEGGERINLSYATTVEFFNRIAHTHIHLTPSNDDVLRCKAMLMELCPDMFVPQPMPQQQQPQGLERSDSVVSVEPTEWAVPLDERRPSPVSVANQLCEQVVYEQQHHRKRSRS